MKRFSLDKSVLERMKSKIRSPGKNQETNKKDEQEKEQEEPQVLVDPSPVINPPEGCMERPRSCFDYKPLPKPTSIRLVKLHSDKDDGDESETISCSIVTVDLEDAPKYIALSYTWGDPRTIYTDKRDIFPREHWMAPAFDVLCDGRPVSVGTNLYTALLNIRLALSRRQLGEQFGPEFFPHDVSGSYVWIDALCINQEDLAEKSAQVPLMGRIYSQAGGTIMWLGGGEPLITWGAPAVSVKVKKLLARLAKKEGIRENNGRYGKALWERCQSFDIVDPASHEKLGLEPITAQELVGWYLFFSRSWFKRAWVVQEWALSKTCVMICGAAALHSDALWDMQYNLTMSGWLDRAQNIVQSNIVDVETGGVPSWDTTPGPWHRSLGGVNPNWGGVPEMYRTSELRNGLEADYTTTTNIAYALRSMSGYGHALKYPPELRAAFAQKAREMMDITIDDLRNTYATDSRDKIFAFYNLFNDAEGRPIYPAPDYTQSVAQVYAGATQVLAQQRGIKILASGTGTRSNPHRLPSWATDFDRYRSENHTETMGKYDAAAGLDPAVLAFSKDLTVLETTGIRVDKVARVQEEPLGAGDLLQGFRDLIELLSSIPEYSQMPPLPSSDEESVIAGKGKKASLDSGGRIEPGNSRFKALLRSLRPRSHKDETSPHGSRQAQHQQGQSRFEVLWRTLLGNYHGDQHPAPAQWGDVYLERLRGFVRLHVCTIFFHDLKVLAQELDVSHPASLFQIRNHREMGEGGLPPGVMELTAAFPLLGSDDKPYDRESEAAAVREMHATIAALEAGTLLPPDTEPSSLPEPEEWTRMDACWRAVLAAKDARDFDAYRAAIMRGAEELGALCLRGEAKLRLYRELSGFADSRVLFATEGGRLGLDTTANVTDDDDVRGGAEPGDEVWVLPGLHVPVVLRRYGADAGRYSVVGCVYLHGIMHGEAVVGRADEELETICLV